MTKTDYFPITAETTEDSLRASYLEYCKSLHPDKQEGSKVDFQTMSHQYQTARNLLTDLKEMYDVLTHGKAFMNRLIDFAVYLICLSLPKGSEIFVKVAADTMKAKIDKHQPGRIMELFIDYVNSKKK